MPYNGLEPLVIEIVWHLGVVIIVWRNLLQSDCLPWKDPKGPTLDDGHSWHRKRCLLRRSMNRIVVGKLSKWQIRCPIILLVVDCAPQILF
jgi:hypothetical protein